MERCFCLGGRSWVGSAKAADILYSGGMYSAEEALDIDLIQAVTREDQLIDRARRIADDLAAGDLAATLE